FFDCFNQQRFFEAHEVLEELWLPERGKPKGLFYQGLIQLAGAFVHVQKSRLGPARALFRLADENLEKYLPVYEELDVVAVRELILDWLLRLELGPQAPNSLLLAWAPRLFPKNARGDIN